MMGILSLSAKPPYQKHVLRRTCTILPAICSTCAASLHAARIFGSVYKKNQHRKVM